MSNRFFLVNCSPNPSHSNWSEKSLPQFPICLADFCQKSFVLPLKGMLVLLSKEFGGCWRLFGGWRGLEGGWMVLDSVRRGREGLRRCLSSLGVILYWGGSPCRSPWTCHTHISPPNTIAQKGGEISKIYLWRKNDNFEASCESSWSMPCLHFSLAVDFQT